MNKTKLKMTKPAYLGLSILDISKMAIHEYWHDYVKPKYVNKTKLCYSDTDSFIVHIKQEHCVKSVQIRSIFWSLFSHIYPYSVRMRGNRDQLKTLYLDTFHTVEDIYTDLAEYVEMRINTSNYEFERPLPIAKNE